MRNIDNSNDYVDHRTPEYQHLMAIRLQEIAGAKNDNSSPIIEITAAADTPAEEVERKVRKELSEQNWWLQDYWSKKGVPTEQIVIETPIGNLEVYNFGDPLEQRHLDELQTIFQALSQINTRDLLQKIRYLLIDNIQKTNPYSGEAMNGYGPIREKAAKLYPAAIRPVPYRVPTASNLSGTIIHELSHPIANELSNEWMKQFGWTELDEPEILPGGARQYYRVENPQNCVNDYARLKPDEDICESMVAYMTHYDALDPARKEFIESRLLGDNLETGAVTISQKTGNAIELPKVAEPVQYHIKSPKKFNINQ